MPGTDTAPIQLPQLEDLPEDLDGASVLLRSDVNVPLVNTQADTQANTQANTQADTLPSTQLGVQDASVPRMDGPQIAGPQIADDFRIRSSMDTLCWLLERNAKVTLCGHLGRPKGKPDPKFSMQVVQARLRELLASDSPRQSHWQERLSVLENLRFNAGETANDPDFVAALVSGQDFYVNDAFGASHRAHASIVGPPQFLPSAAGRLLYKEVAVLSGIRQKPRRPFVAVLGGAKVSDKLGVVRSLLERVDILVVGGAMAFTFLAARGHNVGASLCEPEFISECAELLLGEKPVLLPTDLVARNVAGAGDELRMTGANLPEGWAGMDIGPGTAAEFCDAVTEAGCVFWNGPMGLFEDERFAAGTRTLAEAINSSAAFTVIGGGDTAAAAAALGYTDGIDHISTGGGASLELLEKGDLPGLVALRK